MDTFNWLREVKLIDTYENESYVNEYLIKIKWLIKKKN